MSDDPRRALHDLRVGIHAENFVTHLSKFVRYGHTESPKAEHENVLARLGFASSARTQTAKNALGLGFIQRLVPPRATGMPGCADALPGQHQR